MSSSDKRLELQSLENETDSFESQKKFLSVPDAVRKYAATILIGIYGLVLLFALVIFFFQGVGCSEGRICAWDKASENALELLKIGVMPVITLVIGYYFAKNEKD